MATLTPSRLVFLIGSPPLHQAYELTNRRHAEHCGCQPGGREPRQFLVGRIPAAPSASVPPPMSYRPILQAGWYCRSVGDARPVDCVVSMLIRGSLNATTCA